MKAFSRNIQSGDLTSANRKQIKSAASFEGAHANTFALGSFRRTCKIHSTTVTVYNWEFFFSEPKEENNDTQFTFPVPGGPKMTQGGDGLTRTTATANRCSSFNLLL